MATRLKAAKSASGKVPGFNRLAGKSVLFAGKFDWGVQEDLERIAKVQQGKVKKKLDASVDYLVMQDLSGGKALQKQGASLNAKGASIQLIDTDAFKKLVEPTADEVLKLIRNRNEKAFAAIFGDSHFYFSHQPNPAPRFTFTSENFDGLDLSGMNFEEIAFEQCSFVGAKIGKSLFAWAKRCDFDNAQGPGHFKDVDGSRFVKANLKQANFEGSIADTDFSWAVLEQATFSRDLYGSSAAKRVDLPGCVFARASLKRVKFENISLKAPDFESADLSGSDLDSCSLEGANFRKALLIGVEALDCRMPSSDLTSANCRHANFANADLTNSRVDDTNLANCNLRGAKLGGVNLSKAKNYDAGAIPAATVGPALTELDSLAKTARRIQISFRVRNDETDDGETVVLDTSGMKYGRGLQALGRAPNMAANATLSDTMVLLVNLVGHRQVGYETVNVQSTKSPKGGKELRDLVMAGIAEAFAQPVPPADELAKATKAHRQKSGKKLAALKKQRDEAKRKDEEAKKREVKKIEKTIEKQVGKVTDIATFLKALELRAEKAKIEKATKMLKAERFQLFKDIGDAHLYGVVKSQTDPDLVYACRIEAGGHYACCTQNLNICGGLRGSICKHLLVLIIGLVKAGELDPTTIDGWVSKTHDVKPELNKETMGEIFIRYKGAEAGEVDWRPTQTVPEDYYAL